MQRITHISKIVGLTTLSLVLLLWNQSTVWQEGMMTAPEKRTSAISDSDFVWKNTSQPFQLDHQLQTVSIWKTISQTFQLDYQIQAASIWQDMRQRFQFDHPIQSNSVWKTMSQTFQLNHQVQSTQVQRAIRSLLSDQNKFNHILNAASPYIYFIYEQTKRRHLPAELALIPFIESEFNPNDHSKKGATGLWQLMSETAHELGVKVKSGYDGRRNVLDSTKAALAYFRDLGSEFKGNWYLAIAAYNCGQVTVLSDERRSGNQNVWALPLPHETKDYVSNLLAVAAIIANPEQYGIKLPPVTNAPHFAVLQFKKSISLAEISKFSGINMRTLNTLNPDYIHGLIAKNGSYSVLVPIDKVPAIETQLKKQEIVVKV